MYLLCLPAIKCYFRIIGLNSSTILLNNFYLIFYRGFIIKNLNYAGTLESEENHNVSHLFGNDCHRPCIEHGNRVCYFKFVLEYYHAMGP